MKRTSLFGALLCLSPAVGAETATANAADTAWLLSATALARWLEAHPGVARVHYPGLASHPQHALALCCRWLRRSSIRTRELAPAV